LQYACRLLGLKLSIAQSFSVAAFNKYGSNIPLERNGQQQARTALFRTAAFYSLSEEETKEVLQHPECFEYFFTLVNYVKQYKYRLYNTARVFFGQHVFCNAIPIKKYRGKHANPTSERGLCSLLLTQAASERLGLQDEQSIMHRPDWTGTDGQPKFKFLIPCSSDEEFVPAAKGKKRAKVTCITYFHLYYSILFVLLGSSVITQLYIDLLLLRNLTLNSRLFRGVPCSTSSTSPYSK